MQYVYFLFFKDPILREIIDTGKDNNNKILYRSNVNPPRCAEDHIRASTPMSSIDTERFRARCTGLVSSLT